MKVFFDYVNVPKLSSANGGIAGGLPQIDGEGVGDSSLLGYNMCECGFEGISLKVAKRSCNNQDSGGGGAAEVGQKGRFTMMSRSHVKATLVREVA